MRAQDGHRWLDVLQRLAVFVAAGLLGACAPDDVWFDASESSAVVLVALGPDGARAWSALPGQGAERIELASDLTQTLYALEYDEPLAEPLPAGSLILLEPPAGAALARPTRLFAADLSEGEISSWQEQREWPNELDRVRLSGDRTPCLSFETVIVEVPDTVEQWVGVAIPLGGDRILLGTEDAKLYVVDLSLPVAVTATSTVEVLPSLVAGAFWEGEFWFVSLDGRLAHGSPETGFVEGPPLPSRSQWRNSVLLPSLPGEPKELAFWSGDHDLLSFDGTSWRELSRSEGSGNFARALRLGPADFIASSDSLEEGILHVKDGRASFERLDDSLGVRPFSMTRTEALGILLGTERGKIFERQGGTWVPQRSVEGVGKLYAVAPWGGDLIVGGDSGVLAQHVPGWGTCELIVPLPADLMEVIPLEHAMFLRPRSLPSMGLSAVFLVPRP